MHDNSSNRGQLYGVLDVDAGIHTGSVQTNDQPKVEKNNGGLPQGGAQVGLGAKYSEPDSSATIFNVLVGPFSITVAEGPDGVEVTDAKATVPVGPQTVRPPVGITTNEPIQPIRQMFSCPKVGSC